MPTRRQYNPARKSADTGEHADAYEQVTARIIEALEAGDVPWHKPWRSAGGWPASMSTGKPYRGVNTMLLGFSGHACKWWGTYRQIQELGGNVRKGEKSTLVTFWKELQVEGENEATGEAETKRIPMLRTFRCFNWTQADWPEGSKGEKFAPKQGAEIEPDAEAESVIGAYLAAGKAAQLAHDVHGQAHYVPATDMIHIPPASEHTSAGRYYSTLFHELTHSTGHSSRLDRWPAGTSLAMHTEERGIEELTAEMGAAFLNAECGTGSEATEEASAAYLRSWLAAIKSDKKMVIKAASAGQRAADLILEPSRQAVPEAAPSEPESPPERDEAADLVTMRAAMARTAGHVPQRDREAV